MIERILISACFTAQGLRRLSTSYFSLIITFYCVKVKEVWFLTSSISAAAPPWTRPVFRTSAYNGPWVWASIIPSECTSVVCLLAPTTGNRFEFIVTIMQDYKIEPAKIIRNIQCNGPVEYWIYKLLTPGTIAYYVIYANFSCKSNQQEFKA